ncbi:MAG: hypothetical protein F6J95_020560 [Leptolyngbya sp. SIO1E4]|nr:hypothetical protein [Leptolyngbya sp. SIO1E4]
MTDMVDCEKLAGVLNRASAQGKAGFCKMLWGNQSESVQSKLLQFLSDEARTVVTQPPA